jgi:hypothetical protein
MAERYRYQKITSPKVRYLEIHETAIADLDTAVVAIVFRETNEFVPEALLSDLNAIKADIQAQLVLVNKRITDITALN